MIGRFPIYPSLPAADIERARTWYADKLGLAPVSDNGSGILGYVSGGVSFILYRTGAAGSARNTAAGWLVDDLESAMAELRARGVAFEDYAMGRTGPTTVNGVATDRAGVRSAWFRDSEGNILTIVQLPPGMRG